MRYAATSARCVVPSESELDPGGEYRSELRRPRRNANIHPAVAPQRYGDDGIHIVTALIAELQRAAPATDETVRFLSARHIEVQSAHEVSSR